MDRKVDCQVFQDQLDALVKGALPEGGVRQLRTHASGCPECAMLLRVQEHLLGPSLAALEAQVPDELLSTLWSGVKAGVETGQAGANQREGDGPLRPRPAARRFAWLVPTLAAATVVLLFSNGFLFLESGRLRDRESVLTQQVSEQQRWMAELAGGAAANPVARTAALAGRESWMRALARQESVSVGDLRQMLRRLPGDRVILSQARLESVLRNRTPVPLPLLRDALARIRTADGVTASGLLQALDALDVGAEMTVPTVDLLALLS